MPNTPKTERDAEICAFYAAGHSMRACCVKYKLGDQRITQILRKGGVWLPRVKGERTTFVGAHVTPEAKGKLQQKASAAGKSVSRFTSDLLEEL